MANAIFEGEEREKQEEKKKSHQCYTATQILPHTIPK
jgi:hypothetical protein